MVPAAKPVLFATNKYSNCESSRSSEGSSPLKRFDARSKCFNASNFLIVTGTPPWSVLSCNAKNSRVVDEGKSSGRGPVRRLLCKSTTRSDGRRRRLRGTLATNRLSDKSIAVRLLNC